MWAALADLRVFWPDRPLNSDFAVVCALGPRVYSRTVGHCRAFNPSPIFKGSQLQRNVISSPLVRLLSAWDGVQPPTRPKDWAQPLSHWLGPVEAMALRAALRPETRTAAPAPACAETGLATPRAQMTPLNPLTPLMADLRQLRQTLLTHIAAQEAPPPARSHRHAPPPTTPHLPTPAPEFGVYKLRCATLQRRMEWHIDPFRQHCREVLSNASTRLRHLVELDHAMEKILGNREKALLAKVPLLLARRFDSLKRSQTQPTSDAPQPGCAPLQPSTTRWLDQFEAQFQAVLAAEMDFRLEPIVAMIEEFNSEVH